MKQRRPRPLRFLPLFAVACSLSLSGFPVVLYAAAPGEVSRSLSMTIAPPLFQISLAPGAKWSSTIRLTNSNEYRLKLYATVQNFNASGETGMIVFTQPRASSSPRASELASWITPPREPITIEAGRTAKIPFTINVPLDAEPGGHYAAILVGTAPLSMNEGGEMAVGSLLSSLFLVRVTGDVIESGYVNDFSAASGFVERQEATLKLRFVNTGNVHLDPKGTISIMNMFGRDRGKIIIDEQHTFGRVLPNSVRQFVFTWKGEQNFFDIGRYKAVAALFYGEGGEKIAYYTTHFWVVPLKPLFSMIAFFAFFVWFARRIVRHSLERALVSKYRAHAANEEGMPFVGRTNECRALKRDSHEFPNRLVSGMYRPYYVSVVILVIGFGVIIWYFFEVFESERSYQMIIKKDGTGDIVITH